MALMVELQPIGMTASAARSPGCWAVESSDAHFEIAMPADGLRAGWKLVRGTLLRRGGDYDARLYFDLGNGFGEESYFPIPTSGKGAINEVICFPTGIKRLRFVPTRSAEEFELSGLSFAHMDEVERIWRMSRRVMAMIWLHPARKRKLLGLSLCRILTDLQGAYVAAGKLLAYAPAPQYAGWIAQFDSLNMRECQQIKNHIALMKVQPIISLLLPLRTSVSIRLAATVESVCAQIYPHWSLTIILGTNCAQTDLEVLDGFLRHDSRIGIEFIDSSQVLAAGVNEVFERQLGEYVGLLGDGDLLPKHALYCIAAEVEKHSDAKLIYSDEDSVDAIGMRFAPVFKPDWNPQLLLSQNYLGGLCVFSADLLRQAGGIQNLLGDGQAYDLSLRTTENIDANHIRHVPLVLYHRRASQAEKVPRQSIRPTRDMLLDAGRQSLEAHFARMGIRGEVCCVPKAGGYRIRYTLSPRLTLVSIIIPTRDGLNLLRRCIDSIRERSTYPSYEIIVVDNQSSDLDTLTYLDALAEHKKAKVIRYQQPFNYSAINNFAVRHTRGDVLCLLNNDTEIITPEWIEEMLGVLYQKGVGVVGSKLLYPNGTVQHGGDLVGVGGVANHVHAFMQRDDPGYQGRALLAQDVSAVTGACLMVWKTVYEELGGLDESHLPVAFNDVDFCLRAREAGHRVVWTPHAELYHHESVSRGKDISPIKARRAKREVAYMRKRWKHVMNHDPFYNPNLSHERPDFSLSHAPMVEKPWQN